jgi:hypothetical protein
MAPEASVETKIDQCPVCGSAPTVDILSINSVPIFCNVQWPTKEEARCAPTGSIVLAMCRNCGHFFNRAFESDRITYSPNYENSLHFSPHFQAYAETLARDLVERFSLRNKTIVEIGSGRGDFLTLLCELGGNRGVGYDPGYFGADSTSRISSAVLFVNESYTTTTKPMPADLICARHTLEHIPDPLAFLRSLRQQTGADNPNTWLYFEVPNMLYTLRDGGVWDLIYEHCSYFSSLSLMRLFERSGFQVTRLAEAYDYQFLQIEALPAIDSVSMSRCEAPVALNDVVRLGNALSALFEQRVATMRGLLDKLSLERKRVAIWGAGSKGVTFLNILGATDHVVAAIDVNPRKQGKFVAGTGQEIVAPEKLSGLGIDAIIMMNRIYYGEIRSILGRLGVPAQLYAA